MTHRPQDERSAPYYRDQRQAHPPMQDWQRLHDAMAHLGREIIAPVRPLIIRVLDGLMVVLNSRESR
jgi:hypothetical protein